MSEDAASASEAAAIGPGRLVLVVGPSGAGKDTLLGLARAACAEDSDILFPRRVVTRESSTAEDNIAMSVEEFSLACEQGSFAVHWQAHGHGYGLPVEINDDIRAGRTVVVNVSRTVLSVLRRGYENVVAVAITAPPEVLAERLAARARVSDGSIQARLDRSVDEADVDVTIVNAGSAEYHSRQLVRIIRNACWNE